MFIRLTCIEGNEIARVRIADISIYKPDPYGSAAKSFVSMSNKVPLYVKEAADEIDALIKVGDKGFKQYRLDVLREVAECQCNGCNHDFPVELNASDAIVDGSCKWVHRHKDGTFSACCAEVVQDLIQAELKD